MHIRDLDKIQIICKTLYSAKPDCETFCPLSALDNQCFNSGFCEVSFIVYRCSVNSMEEIKTVLDDMMFEVSE